MWNVVYIVVDLVIVRISQWLWQWSHQSNKYNGKLPPGSMGFPLIGETISFFKSSGFLEIPPFFLKRMLRYGSLFRTNIWGSNIVVATDADVVYEIFRQENESFVISYPDVMIKVLGGKDNVFQKTGSLHKHIKQTTLQLVGSEGLKRKMIGSMNQTTREHLRLKAKEGTFDLRDAVSSMIVSYMTPKLISNLKPEIQAKLIEHFKAFNFDWIRSPFAPSSWKSIYKVNMACREASKVIKEAFERRKESRARQGDFLDTLLDDMEKNGSMHHQDSVINFILTMGIVSKETTSTITALAVKFISKNPKVLSELKREHEAILEKRADKEAGVSWEEYKSNLTFTRMVIIETLRLSNLATILFRKALKDVEIKGYTIPAGWMVVVAPSVLHYNSAIYENPLEFNPWRWEGKDLRLGSKTLMVFGGGMRLCAGAEFVGLQLTIFLHYLVTAYDFSVVQECELIRSPFASFTKELLISISPSERCASTPDQ